jgi:hypothetical protein
MAAVITVDVSNQGASRAEHLNQILSLCVHCFPQYFTTSAMSIINIEKGNQN